MRVLVTGASGFVGRWAVASLVERGAETVAVSRRPVATSGASTIACDLLDAAAARKLLADVKPDVVLHLAWTVEHGKFWTAPDNLDWASASLALMRAAADTGVRHFVGVGTCFEYAWPATGDCEERATPLAPTTLYAVAKDAVRRVGEEWGGLPFAWARLFYLYGPEENGMTGPVNIASGEGPTIREIGEALARIADRPDLLKIGALPDRAGDPARIVGSAARLREEAGFSPKFGLLEGLADVYACHASRVHSAP